MKKLMRKLTGICLSLVMVLSLVGCGSQGTEGTTETVSDTSSTSEYSGQELNVFIWPEYIPDEVIQDFEDKYGVKVNMSNFHSNEELLTKLQNSSNGTYDVITPSDFMVKHMADQDLLSELDYSKLTNVGNMDENYMKQSFDEENKYSIPIMAGEYVICYDASVVNADEIKDLDDLFDSKWEGKITAVDDMRITMGMANMSLGFSLNESNPDNLEKVRTRLMDFKKNVYALDYTAVQEKLLSGESPVGYTWNGFVALANQENENIKTIWPENGSYIWIDNYCIPKSAGHAELANEFINYMMDAEVNKKHIETYPMTNVNKAGNELIADEIKNLDGLIIPEEHWKKCQYLDNLDEDTTSIYNEIWTEFTN